MSSRFKKISSKPGFRVAIGVSLVTTLALGLWLLRPAEQFTYDGLKCQAAATPSQTAAINAQQLTEILLLAERTKTTGLQNILPAPACTLPDIEMRPGAILKRNVYRLAFNDKAVLIVGIEGDEYVGFKLRGLQEGAVTVSEDRPITLTQKWQVKVGDEVNGAQVIGSLGQVSIKLSDRSAMAPFDGSAVPANAGCTRFDGLDVPGYAFMVCGLDQYKFGLLNKGQRLGSGNIMLVGVLRRQSDGAWAFVEPSSSIVGLFTAKQ